MVRCRNCKFYKEVYSPMPGESWDRCKVELLEGADKKDVNANKLQYCSNLNSNNDCRHYKQNLSSRLNIVLHKDRVYWWKKYY